MKKVKSHTFNGVKFDIHFLSDADGACGSPKEKNSKPDIEIFCRPQTKKELRVIIHEVLHAENYNTNDGVIDRVSTELGSFLWRLGYRKK